jgi:4-alpha-glucanotransferase
MAIVPLQDVLGLDGSHRMNTPGTMGGNWHWRFAWDSVGSEAARGLGAITAASGRGPFALLRG